LRTYAVDIIGIFDPSFFASGDTQVQGSRTLNYEGTGLARLKTSRVPRRETP
jgi:peptide subunit release factor RF-3